jgi:thiamine biosynthesis lipoprotein
MGTAVEIGAEGAEAGVLHRAVDAAFREMGRLIDMMSHYDPRSVVSAIGDAAGSRPVAAPPELMAVLGMAQRLAARTAGAFDVTVGALAGWRFGRGETRVPPPDEIAAQLPLVDYRKLVLDERAGTAFLAAAGMRLDLGGIAKAYILRAGLGVLERAGIARAIVNGGGDVVLAGGGDGPPWRVGVRDPRSPANFVGVLEVTRGFVLASGDYERYFIKDGRRYHHVLDPRTGYPATGARGATLLGGELEAVNGLSVAAMVLGREAGAALAAATPGVDGLIVDAKGSWMSPGFRARLAPEAQDRKRALTR